jgi:serine phosphatase RsbU (regulator of sigma subunit)
MDERLILVVEDDATLRELLSYRLADHCTVMTAVDGVDALEKIGERRPDLIVCDVMMPRMDGFTLLDKLQEDRETRAIPFVFLTARTDEDARIKGLRLGVDDFITKPFDMEQLLSRTKRLLERVEVFSNRLDTQLGRDFSQRLMPTTLPEVPSYELFVRYAPSQQGGGDFLDWQLLDDGRYFFAIGDVMGKGLQAKFYAYSFLSYVRASLRTRLSETPRPADMMAHINTLLLSDQVLTETFASFLLLVWDPEAHTLTYSNAGHCRPLLVDADDAHLVEDSDLILGLTTDTAFEQHTLELKPETAFVAYTDGLLEQTTTDGGAIGEDGVCTLARKAFHAHLSVDALWDAALDAAPTSTYDDDTLIFWLTRMSDPSNAFARVYGPDTTTSA